MNTQTHKHGLWSAIQLIAHTSSSVLHHRLLEHNSNGIYMQLMILQLSYTYCKSTVSTGMNAASSDTEIKSLPQNIFNFKVNGLKSYRPLKVL